MAIRTTLAGCWLALLVGLSGCTGVDATNAVQGGAPGASSPISLALPTTDASPGGGSAREDAGSRGCDSAVVGPDVSGYPEALTLGPVTFGNLGEAAHRPAEEFTADDNGRLLAWKTVVQVAGGAAGPVRVAVEPKGRVALLYSWGPSSDGRYPLGEGTSQVVLHPCRDRGFTQFNGGLLVDGPQCVRLNVTLAAGERHQADVPFAGGTC